MPWRHLIPLLFLATSVLLAMLYVTGLLALVTDPEVVLGGWHLVHGPAEWLHQRLLVYLPADFPGQAVPFIYPGLALAQQVVTGYLLGAFFDLPWEKWLHRKSAEEIQEEELHRDLKIAARVAERLEKEEEKKKALREKVARLKAQKKGGERGEENLEAAT